MRRRFMILRGDSGGGTGGIELPPNDEIWYTSTDGNIVEPWARTAFLAEIMINKYYGDKGVMLFDSEIPQVGDYALHKAKTLDTIILPNSVSTIGKEAFSESSLTSIIMTNVTEIGQYAFYQCIQLTSIDLPPTLEMILANAFALCYNIESIVIPASCALIDNYAFDDCTKLRDIYCKATEPPRLGSNVFRGIDSNAKIYVPTASVGAYQSNSTWRSYRNKIVGYEF